MKAVLVAAALAIACASGALSAAQTESRSTQIAHINHFFATVDPATASAIRDSEFLRRFANFEVRTTTGTQSTWTGRYLAGRQTYIEFFAPEDFAIDGAPAPIGAWGIGLSGDRRGSVADLKSRLEAAGHQAVIEPQTRRFGDRTVPWFSALTAVSAYGDSGGIRDTVLLWAMEYEPSYFELAEAAKEPAENEQDVISRERYQPDSYLQRMMRDVSLVEFELPPGDYARIEPLLRAAGYRMRRSGNRVTARGLQDAFVFNLSRDRRGLRRIEFTLNRPQPRRVETIGRSRLAVGPAATATWTFE